MKRIEKTRRVKKALREWLEDIEREGNDFDRTCVKLLQAALFDMAPSRIDSVFISFGFDPEEPHKDFLDHLKEAEE